MSDLISVSITLIASGIFAVLGLYFLKKVFVAFADYLEETRHFRSSVKPKKELIVFFKKQTDRQ